LRLGDDQLTFDIPYRSRSGEITQLRVKVDDEGIMIWRRAQGNLDSPRPLDKIIKLSWETAGKAGMAWNGTRTGHEVRGPAAGRNGLGYLTHKRR
jgi:hypothetical protein